MVKRVSYEPQSANLNIEQKRAAIPKLLRRIDEVKAFDPEAINGFESPIVTALEQKLDSTLTDIFGHKSVEDIRYSDGKKLYRSSGVLSLYGTGPTVRDIRQNYEKGKADVIAILETIVSGFREDLEYLSEAEITKSSTENSAAEGTPKLSRKIFIVHGHDEAAKQTVARFIKNIDLDPIILHEQVSKNRTIIEKIEAYSDVEFAIVLLTPDDVGRSIADASVPLSPRARQNVIFELGYFIGHLKRHKVFALVKGQGMEILSDYNGVVFTTLDDAGAWKLTLAREIEAAGVSIDFNKVIKAA